MMQPIQDIVMCTVNPDERVLASGLVIPHVNDPDRQHADERDVGTVVAAGPGRRLADGSRRPMSVAAGEKIVFGRNKGQLVRHRDRDYCVLREEHLPEHVSEGGVVIPEFRDRDEATVIAVGPGLINEDGTLEAPSVEVGDVILYNPRMAEPFEQAGRKLIALHEAHIVCVTNRDPA